MNDLLYQLYIARSVIEDYRKEIQTLEVWAKDSYGIKWTKECLEVQEKRVLELILNFVKQHTELVEN